MLEMSGISTVAAVGRRIIIRAVIRGLRHPGWTDLARLMVFCVFLGASKNTGSVEVGPSVGAGVCRPCDVAEDSGGCCEKKEDGSESSDDDGSLVDVGVLDVWDRPTSPRLRLVQVHSRPAASLTTLDGTTARDGRDAGCVRAVRMPPGGYIVDPNHRAHAPPSAA